MLHARCEFQSGLDHFGEHARSGTPESTDPGAARHSSPSNICRSEIKGVPNGMVDGSSFAEKPTIRKERLLNHEGFTLTSASLGPRVARS